MKFLITESQFDKVIFKYLDNQDFVKIENSDYIFFINSEGDEFAKIKYDKYDSWCYIYYGLIDEISTFFSFDYNNSKELIGNWVENTLEMEVDGIQPITLGYLSVKDI